MGLCKDCVKELKARMLTTYCMRSWCDRCGSYTDTAVTEHSDLRQAVEEAAKRANLEQAVRRALKR